MQVKEIYLKDFRNFDELKFTAKNIINIFIGANAQGKTNLLEAIYYTSLGRSQRVQRDLDLIHWGAPQAIIRLIFDKLGVEQSIAIELSEVKPRRILLNDQPIKIKNLIGKFNTVLFAPEDLSLIKGAPANRRKFLDAEMSQASPVYFADLLTYHKILNQRNVLLKQIRDGIIKPNSLELWNEQITAAAVKVITKRREAVKKINQLANNIQNKISTQLENLDIIYEIPGAEENVDLQFDLNMWYYKKLVERKNQDIARGSTTFGPHHDDLKFLINGRDLKSFGSQGQQRTAALALKLSELEFLKIETGDYPILLLDDVMSELDSQRRLEILDFLSQQKIQTFITAADSSYFPNDINAKFFNVKSAVITER